MYSPMRDRKVVKKPNETIEENNNSGVSDENLKKS